MTRKPHRRSRRRAAAALPPAPARRRAAAAMHTVHRAAHRPVLPPYGCTPCGVRWAGGEADCWCCGSPASIAPARPAAALHRLLAAPPTAAPARVAA
ncbi:hypothetical protein [Streptomyces aidingensis]|uniref:Uncharacterized protein n=1 Tax=Streptomyces aidingensis TaxID=910347 RepID=A0A1I1V1Z5_9ACTN|nr:hypothetical protein [Streptomyces aidingensis]SFD74320.1 hypothetical protein SAMN05421773_12715 [Streptomyces aidingensis]